MNAIEINYNDIFSKDEIGRSKFQNLLVVLQAQNLRKISGSLGTQPSKLELKNAIRNYFGFSESEIYTLFELERDAGQGIEGNIEENIKESMKDNVEIKSKFITIFT